jgi:hypothetical protein
MGIVQPAKDGAVAEEGRLGCGREGWQKDKKGGPENQWTHRVVPSMEGLRSRGTGDEAWSP